MHELVSYNVLSYQYSPCCGLARSHALGSHLSLVLWDTCQNAGMKSSRRRVEAEAIALTYSPKLDPLSMRFFNASVVPASRLQS
jgi:hypothetical protein